MLKSTDRGVMVKPFQEKGIMVNTSSSGIRFVGNYDTLVMSEAIADGPGGIKTGDTIYISGTLVKAPWAKTVYQVKEGVAGVLVPFSDILLVDDHKE